MSFKTYSKASSKAAAENTTTSSASVTWHRGFRRDLSIVAQLVGKDFKLKYRRSFLGVLWSVLNPLFMMAVMSVVFTNVMRFSADDIRCYPLYLIIGNITFQLMSDGTSQGMSSIIGAASLLKKVKVNRLVFPVYKVIFAGVNFFFSLIAVALVMIWFQIFPTWRIVFFPIGLLYLTVFTIGLSLILSALAVFFRDVMHLWGVVLTAWMYLTPLFYSIKILPDYLRPIMKFNPMYQYVTFMRDILINHATPSINAHILCGGFALATLVIGYAIFHKLEHKFILYI